MPEAYNMVKEFNIFPNPNPGNVLSVVGPVEDNNYRINIQDVQGREIMSHSLAAGTSELDILELAAGMYFVSLQSGEQVLAVRKLVRQ